MLEVAMRLCCMRTRRASLHGGDIDPRIVLVLVGSRAVLCKEFRGGVASAHRGCILYRLSCRPLGVAVFLRCAGLADVLGQPISS